MSDPLSIASLGLTVCQGLIDYVEGLKCRKEDIESTLGHINCLRETFVIIESATSKLSHDHSAATAAVDKILRLSEENLHRLWLVLNELRKEALPSDNLNLKVAAQARKLSYPFRRTNLRRLETSVHDLNGTLQTVLQALDLDVSGSQLQQLSLLAENANTTSSQITTLLDGVTTANQSLAAQDLRLELLNSHLRNLYQTQRRQESCMQSMDREMKSLQLQLISKPDALRTICHNMEKSRRLERTRRQRRIQGCSSSPLSRPIKQRLNMHCSCTGKSWAESRHYTACGVSLSHNTEAYEPHLPGCDFYTPHQKVRNMKARFTYLGYVLSATIAATISITTGAGGFSISPSLSISRVVPNDSCAFALFAHERFGTFLRSYPKETVAGRHQLLENTREQLLKMFCERQASPKDVNERGQSLFHVILKAVCVTHVKEPILLQSFSKLIMSLLTSGVPVNMTDSEGRSPLFLWTRSIWSIFDSKSSLSAMINIAETLVESGSDCTIGPAQRTEMGDGRFQGYSGLNYMLCFSQLIDLAEVFQCGPLSIAILRQSETEVRRILANYPHCLTERNLLDQTPLHLSCDWPLGVEMILEAGGHDIIDSIDIYGFSVFVYACEKCCTAALHLLLAADCCLFPPKAIEYVGSNTHNFAHALLRGNYSTTEALLLCLKGRRNRLKALAFERLPIENLQELLDTSSTILDSKATDICGALKAKGITIPLSLAVPLKRDTVYHLRYLPVWAAEMLYDLGFHDVDTANEDGLTPLMSNRFNDARTSFELSSWLLFQGASLEAKPKAPQGSNLNCKVIAAHFLARKAGDIIARGYFSGVNGELDPDIYNLPIKLSTISERDECHCSCSTGGCRPATVMLKEFVRSWRYSKIHDIDFVNWVTEGVPVTDKAWDWLPREILRFMTFHKLRIKHTCCEPRWEDGNFELQDPEEIDEIREEYAYLLDLLEVLVEEFEAKYVELGVRFIDFFGGYWTERMREVLNELDSVDSEEIQRIRELGVVLEKVG